MSSFTAWKHLEANGEDPKLHENSSVRYGSHLPLLQIEIEISSVNRSQPIIKGRLRRIFNCLLLIMTLKPDTPPSLDLATKGIQASRWCGSPPRPVYPITEESKIVIQQILRDNLTANTIPEFSSPVASSFLALPSSVCCSLCSSRR